MKGKIIIKLFESQKRAHSPSRCKSVTARVASESENSKLPYGRIRLRQTAACRGEIQNFKKYEVLFLALLVCLISSIAFAQKKPGEALVFLETKSKPIRIAVEFTTHSACAHIANQKGWYKEEGLTISSYENFITGMVLAVALAKGDIDAAYICLIPAINAKANANVPIKIVSGIHKYGYGFVVNPDRVKTIDDLKKEGIRIGCSREGSPVDALLHKMIEKYHLDKKQILKKVRRMNSPRLLLALKTGQLDAAFICEQFPTMAEELGFKVFLTAEDLWPDMQGSVLVVREELIKEYPDIVKKLVKVTERATQFINSHPEDAAEIVAGGLQVAGENIFPVKAINAASKLVITPPSIFKSLTVRLINTTDIDPEEIRKTIDTCMELEYIKEAFKAEDFIELTEFIR